VVIATLPIPLDEAYHRHPSPNPRTVGCLSAFLKCIAPEVDLDGMRPWMRELDENVSPTCLRLTVDDCDDLTHKLHHAAVVLEELRVVSPVEHAVLADVRWG